MQTKTSLNILIILPAAIVLFLLILFSYYNYKQQEKALIDKASVTANALSLDAIAALSLGIGPVERKIRRVLTDPELDFALIQNKDKTIVIRIPEDPIESDFVVTLPLTQSLTTSNNDALDDLEYNDDSIAGQITIGVNQNTLQTKFLESLITILFTCAAIIILGLIFITPQKKRITQRIEKLKLALDNMASGNYQNAFFEHDNSEFDAISDKLKKVTTELRSHDLSMRKKTDEITMSLEESDKRAINLESFLAKMAHEIRSPLSVMERSIEFMRATNVIDPQLKSILNEWQQKLDLSLRYTEDLLDISAPHLGLKISKRPFHFESEISSYLRPYTEVAVKKNIKFRFNISSRLDNYFICDKHRIQQILGQLCSNAIKYTTEGSVEVNINWQPQKLDILIKDSGIGISEADINSIFELSYRASSTGAGWGIGLAVVKNLIDTMGGTISVKSEPKKGSTFHVSLPMEASDSSDDTKDNRIRSKLKILVVDNCDEHLIASRTLLSQLAPNAQICTATNGLDAISKIDSTYDMAFIDYRMPKLPGNEVIAEIRKSHPNLYIAALTNSIDQKSEQLCFEAGADAFLSKNLKLFELYNQIKNYKKHGRNTAHTFWMKITDESDHE